MLVKTIINVWNADTNDYHDIEIEIIPKSKGSGLLFKVPLDDKVHHFSVSREDIRYLSKMFCEDE